MAMLKLDDRDLQILTILAREGRISKTALAERINLSPTPCLERLKRLEKAGVITGYYAEIALRKLTQSITVFVTVELESHRAENAQAFERAIADVQPIIACWSIGGGFDYLLQVVARDIDHYQRLIDGLLDKSLGIARYYSYVVTKPVKQSHGIPFDLNAGSFPGLSCE
jgi:Lrp/AsnC family transcriptional regulator, regulator of ectoine-degradation genes